MPRLFELVDFEGKLACYWGDHAAKDRPVRTLQYKVMSGHPAAEYSLILGQVPWLAGNEGSRGYVRPSAGGQLFIDFDGCPVVSVEQLVPQPRNGRTYGWRWSANGDHGLPGWEKDYFPLCDNCRHVHDPAYVECETCGYCHRSGGKCKGG